MGVATRGEWRMFMWNKGRMRLTLLRVCCRVILCSSDACCYTLDLVLSKGQKWLTTQRVHCKWHLQVERLVGDLYVSWLVSMARLLILLCSALLMRWLLAYFFVDSFVHSCSLRSHASWPIRYEMLYNILCTLT